MQDMKARIYGDSIMKGTVIDGAYRYHAVMEEMLKNFKEKYHIETENRSRFGCTIDKGYGLVKKDMERGLDCDYAVVEFGGNDCNFKWDEISVTPTGEHSPLTDPEMFKKTYIEMIDQLKSKGVTPILMTLPPIDAKRYLDFLDRNGNNGKNILSWLGDVNMIYRFHESYSNAIAKIADITNTYLVDVRSYFLDKRNYSKLMCIDGLHPTVEGYRLVCQAFDDFAAKRMNGAVHA